MGEFYYSGYLEELKTLFYSMKELNVDIATFKHSYKDVDSMVIFDTRNDWKLVFIKRLVGDTLEIPVERGYRFTIDGNLAYKEFIYYFGIGGQKGEFSINDFIIRFKKSIPSKYIINDEIRINLLKYDRIDHESEGIYPIRTINWEIVHAKNQKLNPKTFHRSSKNLEKTKQLYPYIYEKTKDMDLTIVYGVIPEAKTEEIKRGIW